MIKPAFVSIAAWGNKELSPGLYDALAEQAWNYGSRRFPPEFEHEDRSELRRTSP